MNTCKEDDAPQKACRFPGSCRRTDHHRARRGPSAKAKRPATCKSRVFQREWTNALTLHPAHVAASSISCQISSTQSRDSTVRSIFSRSRSLTLWFWVETALCASPRPRSTSEWTRILAGERLTELSDYTLNCPSCLGDQPSYNRAAQLTTSPMRQARSPLPGLHPNTVPWTPTAR